MINFLKKLKDIISFEIQLVILGFVSLAIVYFEVDGASGVLEVLQLLLPTLALLAAIWFLAIKKKFSFAYFLLLLFEFGGGLRTIFRWFFSFSFSSFEWDSFSFFYLIDLIFFIYLLLMLISNLLDEKFSLKRFKIEQNLYCLTLGLAVVHLYLSRNFITFFIYLLILLFLNNEDNKLPLYSMLVYFSIGAIFNIIDVFVWKMQSVISVGTWLLYALQLAVLGLTIMLIVNLFKKENPLVSETSSAPKKEADPKQEEN